MKAIKVGQPAQVDTLTPVELPDLGPPGPGQVLVRIHATSLNYHDYAVVSGGIPTEAGRIPMSDGAGVVEAVGEGVTEFKPGDRVVSTFFLNWIDGAPPATGFAQVPGDGVDGYAREYAIAPEHGWTHAPKGWSHAEAATITCAGLTAWRALIVDGEIKPGASVLVQGTGGVSIYALQIAKAMGCTVIATSSSDEKLERLKALGADHLINYRSEPKWGGAVRRLTGGAGVDHVVEIGGAGTLPQSITACRMAGHIALIGVLAGRGGEIPTAAIMGKQIRLQGLTVGSRKHQLDMIRSLEVAGYRPVLDQSFPLEGLADAFRRQESGAHFGKIVVEY